MAVCGYIKTKFSTVTSKLFVKADIDKKENTMGFFTLTPEMIYSLTSSALYFILTVLCAYAFGKYWFKIAGWCDMFPEREHSWRMTQWYLIGILILVIWTAFWPAWELLTADSIEAVYESGVTTPETLWLELFNSLILFIGRLWAAFLFLGQVEGKQPPLAYFGEMFKGVDAMPQKPGVYPTLKK